jgi:hypothetical protein
MRSISYARHQFPPASPATTGGPVGWRIWISAQADNIGDVTRKFLEREQAPNLTAKH